MRLARTIAAVLVVGGVTVANAAPASASTNGLGTFVASNVRIRSTPYTNSPAVYGLGQVGQKACVLNSTHGQTISDGGHTTNTWLYVKDLSTGVGPGWVWEWYISGT